MVTEEEIWDLLEQISDPEIPVLTIIDLGVVRTIEFENKKAIITITPTYSGCPAMQVIEDDIKALLKPIIEVEIKYTLSPAWSTDWISESGRIKLKEYGIAPPEHEIDKSVLFAEPTKVTCPRCNTKNTRMVSQFGSTACKAQYQCNECQEPFDYFKCLK
jgi:ring-1,2-phenylacetyl-CoA epoxidase subunit PaaD